MRSTSPLFQSLKKIQNNVKNGLDRHFIEAIFLYFFSKNT